MEHVFVTVDFYKVVMGVLSLGFLLGTLCAYILRDYMVKKNG